MRKKTMICWRCLVFLGRRPGCLLGRAEHKGNTGAYLMTLEGQEEGPQVCLVRGTQVIGWRNQRADDGGPCRPAGADQQTVPMCSVWILPSPSPGGKCLAAVGQQGRVYLLTQIKCTPGQRGSKSATYPARRQ